MRKRLFKGALPIACLILVSVSAHAQRRVSGGTNQSVRQLILRIENRANLFRNSVQAWSNRNYSQANSGSEDINLLVRDFNDNVRLVRERFDRRQATSADVQELLNRAARVDDFVRRQTLDVRSRNHWATLRIDLNQLGRNYNVSWPQTGFYPPAGNPVVNQFRGTYQLDVSRSDDAQRAADEATRTLAPSERRRIRDLVVQRLQSPEQIAIDVRGRTVTLASTRAPQISFEADGRERVETAQNGRRIRSRATLTANQLTVSSTGDTGNEFTVSFDPIDSGRRMNVLRRVYVQGLTRPVVVQSMYERSSDVAQFNIYSPQNNPTYPGSTGGFIGSDGARVVAVLDSSLSTRTAVVGERFTLRVNEPGEFRGATIEGHVSHVERSGRLTGRSVMTLDCDSIRLRDGRSYRFAGLIEGVRTANGEIVRVDSEGTVRDANQTNRTGERAAIGTAVGAIIGAIAGGGKGAAIGAIIGASSGAGSVYVQGRNDLELGRGSEIVIRSGAPVYTPR
jgi:hypothetical protein